MPGWTFHPSPQTAGTGVPGLRVCAVSRSCHGPEGRPPSLRGSVSCVFSVSCPSRCPSARSPHPAWSTWSIHVRQFQGWALQASESAATVGPEVVMWHQAVPLELAVFVYVLTLTCVTLYGVLLLYTCVLRVTATARLVNTSMT